MAGGVVIVQGADAAVEELSTLGGMAMVSVLHSLMPTHWLPFVAVGRAQQWKLPTTLAVTAAGAIGHTVSTSVLGLVAAGAAQSLFPEQIVHGFASALLVLMGLSYVYQWATGRHSSHCGHTHLPTSILANGKLSTPQNDNGKGDGKDGKESDQPQMSRMAVLGLVMVPTLTPCATTLPMFLAVSDNPDGSLILLCLVLLVCTLSVMTTLVALSSLGASRLKLDFMSRGADKLLVGVCLILVGFATVLLHDHSHHHRADDGHQHGMEGEHHHDA
eukprot:jgi/Chlat1/7461/Chrsp6S07467